MVCGEWRLASLPQTDVFSEPLLLTLAVHCLHTFSMSDTWFGYNHSLIKSAEALFVKSLNTVHGINSMDQLNYFNVFFNVFNV